MYLDAQERSRVAPGEGHRAVLFVLPPAMEHYYAQRTPNYKPAPPWRSGGVDDMPMEVLYPDRGARLLIPIELDGSRGQAVIEVAHRDASAQIHWDLDGTFIGTTTGEHRMALSPADGAHRVTLTDRSGHILHHAFTVVSTKPERTGQ
jgi:penicillin-binding protein 1C